MGTFIEFEQQLREALAHLYDPAYQPAELLCDIVGCDLRQGPAPVQAAVLQAFEVLKPAEYVPSDARTRRLYDLLIWRYREQTSQEETAERLALSPRHLRREQQIAISTLARYLWQRSGRDEISGSGSNTLECPGEKAPHEPAAWRSQALEELAALQKRAPDSVSVLRAEFDRIIPIASALAATRGVGLTLQPVEGNLAVAIHPSALRQILLGGITELVRLRAAGQIELCARREGGCIRITLTGEPASAVEAPQDLPLRELVAMQGGSLEVQSDAGSLALHIDLPSAGKAVVLAVDDNPDLVHLYERFVRGTRYELVSTPFGEQVLGIIDRKAPDIIVLDVMLPDMDGWELLVHLHEDLKARPIPVIVCSVVREEELSLALGARLYLPKPVSRHQFLQALDQALNQDGIEPE